MEANLSAQLLQLSKDANASPAGVLELLKSSGVLVPEGQEIRLRHIYLAQQQNPEFIKNLYGFLYEKGTANANGSSGWTNWAEGIGGALSVLFGTVNEANRADSTSTSDAELKAKLEEIDLKLNNQQSGTASSSTGNVIKYVGIGLGILVLIVVVVLLVKKGKK